MTKIEALELELAARKMVEGIELDWWKLIKLAGSNDLVIDYAHLDRYNSEYLELTLGIVEGRPVWNDSVLYSDNGTEYNMSKLYVSPMVIKKLHWNPPKPKTVMIELPFKVVEIYASGGVCILKEACCKALEEMK